MRQLLHFLLLLDLFGFEVLGSDAVGVLSLLCHHDLLDLRAFHLFHIPLFAQVQLVQHLLLLKLLVDRVNVFSFHCGAT